MQALSLLPQGFTARPMTLDDAEIVAQLFAISAKAQNFQFNISPEELREEWKSPKFVLEESSLGVFNASGELVGEVEIWDDHEIPVHPWVDLTMHPDYFGSGVDEALLTWGLELSRRVIDKCPEHALISAYAGTMQEYEAKIRLLESFGMTIKRYFFRMRIDMVDVPPTPVLPDGFHIQSYRHPDQLIDVIKADDDGFRDHFGYVEQPIEKKIEQWEHWINTDPVFDQTLWYLVIDDATGQIAGTCLCRNEAWGEPEVAYVNKISVRREYRQKGIALAMLRHAFHEFYKRGRHSVTLHVDANSITGAVRLYERAGMFVEQRSVTYEKVLRDGEEIARV